MGQAISGTCDNLASPGHRTHSCAGALMTGHTSRWLLPGLPLLLRGYVLAVTAAGALAATAAALLIRWQLHEALTCLLLLVFGAVTVEVIRRAGEPAGTIKDVHGVWELPIALLLPPVGHIL